jgi:hypothetical protein
MNDQLHAPTILTPRKAGSKVVPRTGLNDMTKGKKVPIASRTRTPVAHLVQLPKGEVIQITDI